MQASGKEKMAADIGPDNQFEDCARDLLLLKTKAKIFFFFVLIQRSTHIVCFMKRQRKANIISSFP